MAVQNGIKDDTMGYYPSLQRTVLTECQSLIGNANMSRANVLEVGCGYGTTTSQIAERFPTVREVLGIDNDKAAINYAFTFVADEKMDFVMADIEDQSTFDLTWASKFDWIFSSNVLLFVRDHASAVRNLMWCLKPGGKCFLAVPASKPEAFHVAANKVLSMDCWKKHLQPIKDTTSDLTQNNCNRLWFHHPHADRVYSALLEQVGYEILHTKLLDFEYTFTSVEEYRGCLKFLIQQLLDQIPEEKQASFFKAFCKAATKKATKSDKGCLTWTIKYILVVAKRPLL